MKPSKKILMSNSLFIDLFTHKELIFKTYLPSIKIFLINIHEICIGTIMTIQHFVTLTNTVLCTLQLVVVVISFIYKKCTEVIFNY